jgi:hypothetical protein
MMSSNRASIGAETGSTPTTTARRTDRFLIGILVGIAALLVVAGITVAMLRQPAPLLPADTPGSTVQRFFAALDQQKYQEAYAFLSDSMQDKPTSDEFARYNLSQSTYRREQRTRIRISDEQRYGNSANVSIEITHYTSGGPFDSYEYTSNESFGLQLEGETWRIVELPWGYRPYNP